MDQRIALQEAAFLRLSYVTVIALSLMACYYNATGGQEYAAIDVLFALGLMGNLLVYRRSGRLQIGVRVGINLGAMSFVSIALASHGVEEGVFLWFFTLPLVTIFLLGRKEGAMWAACYFLVLAAAQAHNRQGGFTYLLRFLLAYVVVTIFAYFYELLREEGHWNLHRAKSQLEQVSQALSRYLSPQIREEIFSGKSEARIQSRRKQLTIFFSDIINFTRTTDHLEAEALTGLLNHYLREMADIAMAHGVTINKFIGDGIVAFCGDPSSRGFQADAVACVKMAVAMRERMHELREYWLQQGLSEPFHLRMGISSGYCTVGNFGAVEQMEYTVIGAQVNLAARLEKMAAADQILIADATYRLIKEEIACKEMGELSMKGIGHPVPTYQVLDLWNKMDENRAPLSMADAPGVRLYLEPEKMSDRTRQEILVLLEEAVRRLKRVSA